MALRRVDHLWGLMNVRVRASNLVVCQCILLVTSSGGLLTMKRSLQCGVHDTHSFLEGSAWKLFQVLEDCACGLELRFKLEGRLILPLLCA